MKKMTFLKITFLGFLLTGMQTFAQVAEVDIANNDTLLFQGSQSILKNPERGFSFKAGYFDLFVDSFTYDGYLTTDIQSCEYQTYKRYNKETFSNSINLPKTYKINALGQDKASYYVFKDLPIADGESYLLTMCGRQPTAPNEWSAVNYFRVTVSNADAYWGVNQIANNEDFQIELNHSYHWGFNYALGFNVGSVYSNQYFDNNQSLFGTEDLDLKLNVTNNGQTLEIRTTGTNNLIYLVNLRPESKLSLSLTNYANEISFSKLGDELESFGAETDTVEQVYKDWAIDLTTEFSSNQFDLNLGIDSTIPEGISYDSVAHRLLIGDEYYRGVAKNLAFENNLSFTALEDDFIEEHGISMVELEQYLHFSEENIANGQDDISEESVNFAINTFDELKDRGLKAHFLMNSDFKMTLSSDGFMNNIPSTTKVSYLSNIINNADEQLYSSINPLVAVSHVGWIREQDEYNLYRLSSTWLDLDYSRYWLNGGIEGDYYPEFIKNKEGSLRSSHQRSSFRFGAGNQNIDLEPLGYPTDGHSQLQYLQELVIVGVEKSFPDKKILLDEVLAWNHKFTFPCNGELVVDTATDYCFNAFSNSLMTHPETDGFQNNKSLGFYDGAFATTLNHLATLSDDPQYLSSDFDSPPKRDLYVLAKHSDRFWVHGDMPVYMSETDFESKFGVHNYISAQNPFNGPWDGSLQFDYQTFKGMLTASDGEQDPILAVKKLRMFNYNSFDLTFNYSKQLGKNLFQKSNVPEGVGAVDKWEAELITKTLADQLNLPYSTSYFDRDSVSVFDYLRDHLGYRLELKNLTTSLENDSLSIGLSIQNRGFSSPKNTRDIYITVLDSAENRVATKKIDVDWTSWKTDLALDTLKQSLDGNTYRDFTFYDTILNPVNYAEYKLNATLDLSTLENLKTYKIALWMPDVDSTLMENKDFAVKLANQGLEMSSTGENILAQFHFESDVVVNPLDQNIEFGLIIDSTNSHSDWTTFTLQNTYTNPVIIFGGVSSVSPSYKRPLAGVRLRNVSSNSFEYLIEEWEYQDGITQKSYLNYIVVDSGEYMLPDSSMLIAGLSNADFSGTTITEDISTKVVFTQLMSDNDSTACNVKVKKNTDNTFNVKVQEQEVEVQDHVSERVGYLILDDGLDVVVNNRQLETTSKRIKHKWSTIHQLVRAPDDIFICSAFSARGPNSFSVKYKVRNNKYKVRVIEETSKDSEIRHVKEYIGFLNIKTPQSSSKLGFDTGSSDTEEENVLIYPNPANDIFTIDFLSDIEEEKSIVLLNNFGQVLESKSLSPGENSVSVDVSAYPSGVYFVKIESQSNRYMKKLIIQN